MECEYCKKKFSCVSSLNLHKKRAKYCLKLRGKVQENKFKCSDCDKEYTSKENLNLHRLKCIYIKYNKQEQKYKDEINNYKTKINYLENNYKTKLINQKEYYENKICIIHDGYEKDLDKLKEKEKECKELRDKLENKNIEELRNLQETLKDIALKSVSKSTTTNNKTKIINNYIQNLKPLTEEHLAECSKHLTLEQIKRGASGYAEYALKYPFKDTVLCVDYSRHKIKMKDKDGHIITDPEMLTSSKMFFKSIFTRNKQLLEEYSNEKEDVINKHGQDYADKLAFELLHYIADVSRGMEGEQSELQRNFVKEICSKKTV